MKFEEFDYPCFYLDSNKASLKSQSIYKRFTLAILFILFTSTILSSLNINATTRWEYLDKLNGWLVLLSGTGSIILLNSKFEKKWYIGRAVSESIKTISWKYMMKSEPFDLVIDKANRELFISRVSEILSKAQQLGFIPALNSIHSDPITKKMDALRNMNFTERKSIYASHRIEDQIKWYAKKSITNKNKSNVFGFLMIIGIE